MKQKRLLFVIVLFFSLTMWFMSQLYIDYKSDREERMKTYTLNHLSTIIEYLEQNEDFYKRLRVLMVAQVETKKLPFDTLETVFEDFKSKEYISILNYIQTNNEMSSIEKIMNAINQVICIVAYYDKIPEEFYDADDTGNRIHYLGNFSYKLNVTKNILDKEAWKILWEKYRKEKNVSITNTLIEDKEFLNILESEDISISGFKDKTDYYIKTLYSKIEHILVHDIAEMIDDFCNYILESKMYENLDLATFSISYVSKPYLYVVNGVEVPYYTSTINIEEIMRTLNENNYPIIYI